MITLQVRDGVGFKVWRAFFVYQLIAYGLEFIRITIVLDCWWLRWLIGMHLITVSAPGSRRSATSSTKKEFGILHSTECRDARNSIVVISHRGLLVWKDCWLRFVVETCPKKRVCSKLSYWDTSRLRDHFVLELLAWKLVCFYFSAAGIRLLRQLCFSYIDYCSH